MASKTGAVLSCLRYSSYTQVANLKTHELKTLCVKYKLDSNLPKKAKIILLCNLLGISTTGNRSNLNVVRSQALVSLSQEQIEEFERLTVKQLCTLERWTVNLLKVPDVEETSVKQYLLNTDILDTKTARTYKVSRPFQLKPFVHSMKYNDNASDTFGIVFSKCNPSQSTNPDDVKVIFAIIDKVSGTPYGGFCTCTVGLSERCGHIGATLFRLADLVASGVKELPSEDKSCTEKLCEWTDPKGAGSQPTVFDEVQISKRAKTLRRTTRDFGKKIANTDPPSINALLTLRASLFDATHELGQYCPAVHAIDSSRYNKGKPTPSSGPSQLPDHTHAMDPDVAYCKEIEVTSKPLPIADIPHTTICQQGGNVNYAMEVNTFLTKVQAMTRPEREEVSRITLGQSNNLDWYQQKRGSIGASNMSRVLKAVEKRSGRTSSLLTAVMGYNAPKTIKPTNVPSLKWGTMNESKAKVLYKQKFKSWHRELQVVESGLVVDENHSFIRVSPDGIVRCKCHKDRLLEVKCPYASRDLTISEAVQQGKIAYLETANGRYQLKKNTSDGYYEQVQGLMGVLKLEMCNFVVWTKVDMAIVIVPFDSQFWEDRLMPACVTFFQKHVVPEIMKHSLKPNQQTKSPVKLHVTATNSSTPTQSSAYRCGGCNKVLPECDIAADNSNASVGCDCKNCSCDVWFCWPCARYDEEQEEEKIDWYCPRCVRNCDIVY